MSFDNYEDKTLAEMLFVVDVYLEKEKRQRKIATGDMFWLASTLAVAIHKPEKMPKSLEVAFPGVHSEVQDNEELQQQRFLEGVQKYNNNRR